MGPQASPRPPAGRCITEACLPGAVLPKLFEKCYRKFEKNVETLKHTRKPVESLSANIAVLSDEEQIRVPPGTRPFRSPSTLSELDVPWSASADVRYALTVVIRRGTSCRQAAERVSGGLRRA